MALSLTLAAGMLVAMGVAGAVLAPPAVSHNSTLKLDSGSTQQWAFGGTASASYSCTDSACSNTSEISSLSLKYYVQWVVIYTVTNISSTQTEVEAQAGINASVSLSLAGCVNETLGPCSEISASASLSGKELAVGFTNITDTGTVDLTSGPGSPATVAADAIMNAQSNASFNFSGSYSASIPVNGTPETESVSFDLGGQEVSGVNFATPLGVVPLNPQPNQWWNSSAPYSATGSYTSGYSLNEDINGHTYSDADWTSAANSPSGTLDVNGTDLGAATLTDNYTNPPSSVTAQIILLTFGSGEFSATDGWLLFPSDLYGGAEGFLGGSDLIANQHPAQGTTLGGSESAYYEKNVGFVGLDEATNTSALGLGSGGPQFSLSAGPEPVSVAQQQYSGITSGAAAASSVPWEWLILGVVVAVIVVVGVVVVVSRRRRQPPTSAMPAGAAPTGSAPGPMGGPSGPTNTAPTQTWAAAPAAPMAAVAAAPVCPTCGQPGTYVSQYSRYYCYNDKRYL